MMYSPEEIAVLRQGGRLLAAILGEVAARVRPGVTTAELDAYAERRIREVGGTPSFLGYAPPTASAPFPSTLCTSVNHEVVHAPAVPARTLRAGDLIGLDLGMRYPAARGLCTDAAVTVGAGEVSADVARLIALAREALARGVAAARAGRCVRDIGQAIQSYVEAAGCSVVRDLVGHGVGRAVHEEPEVPNFVVPGPIGERRLKVGEIIAIEPMVNAGRASVETLGDGWTVATRDQRWSAHFEHTVVVTKQGAEILTIV